MKNNKFEYDSKGLIYDAGQYKTINGAINGEKSRANRGEGDAMGRAIME